MSKHTKWTASQILCDRLVALLEVRIGKVAVNHAKTMCSLGTPNFAWSYHKKSALRIYLYGKDSNGQDLKQIEIGMAQSRFESGQRWAPIGRNFLPTILT